jgi:hypothetical protein
MTQLDKHVQTAFRRLWMNRWFHIAATCLTAAFGVFGVLVLVQRLFELALPVWIIGAGLVVVAMIGSLFWAQATKPTTDFAAAEVDRAAGLSERLSSGLYCRASDDPFARAVVEDADRIARSIRVQEHIRLVAPRSLSWTACSMVLASLAFLVTPGLFQSNEAEAADENSEAIEQAHVAVKKQLDSLKQFADITPEVEDFSKDLEKLQQDGGGKLRRAEDIRHEAIKKIDRLEDALKEKRKSETYKAVPELKKMLRGLKIPEPTDPTISKITQSLAKGDFKTAKEEVEKLKEQLATLKSEEDKEFAKKVGKQLEQLAKKLEEIAKDDKLQQKLEQAGIKKEDAKRMLEKLTKKDLDQLQKQLEKNGMSQKQIEKMKKQMQQKQQAKSMAQKMAQGMKKAGAGARDGKTGQSMAGLKMAGEQLSDLEKLEQEMNEIESAMAGLQNAKDKIDKPCPT